MAYTPNTWATGDTITAQKLNNMEQGIANAGVFYITATWDDSANGFVLDKTAAQIEAAYANGQLCKVVGEFSSEVSVTTMPFGTLIVLTGEDYVDVGSNVLNRTEYTYDMQTGVVTVDEWHYVLTPES